MEVQVQVWASLDECPLRVREALEHVKEAISELSGKVKKQIYGYKKPDGTTCSGKTIGIMSVEFNDGSQTTIGSISGTGVHMWTLEDCKGVNNSSFTNMIAALKDKNIVWADLCGDYSVYQKMQQKKTIISDNEVREEFAKEYKRRFTTKVKKFREVKDLSKDQIVETLQRSAEYRPELARDFKDYVVPMYVSLYIDKCSPYPTKICEIITVLMKNNVQRKQYCVTQLSTSRWYRFFYQLIRDAIKGAEFPPTTAQEVVDRFIAPYKCAIPECMLDFYSTALGYKAEFNASHRLADMTAQCAEDNALVYLAKNRNGAMVRRIEWVAASLIKDTDSLVKLEYKKLCPFCAVAFIPRAKQINSV